jgi:hypothetical protein
MGEEVAKFTSHLMSLVNFTSNAMMVMKSRYLKQNEDGDVIETPEECFQRVACAIARSEPESTRTKWRTAFYNLTANFEFLPAGRAVSIAGTKGPLVSNCVVLHVEDSLDHIFKLLKMLLYFTKPEVVLASRCTSFVRLDFVANALSVDRAVQFHS